MALNALLMLSTEQLPHPVDEINWHVAKCESEGWTEMVAMRVLTRLTPGSSMVAFYGDAALDNRLLGWATFESFRKVDPDGDDAERIELYAGGNHPPSVKGIPRLTDMRSAAAGTTLEALGGQLASNGLALTRENLPNSPARGLVYYRATAMPNLPAASGGPIARSSDPHLRRAQRVLAMVHELHKRGYQRLRIVPGMNSSGSAWRCFITQETISGDRMAHWLSDSMRTDHTTVPE